MSGLKILKSGVLSFVEDLGRFGYADMGVCQSGASDEYSFIFANRLLANSPNTNALEILYGGLSAKFLSPTSIALTGAEANITLNKKPISMWESIKVETNDVLDISFASKGTTIYLAISGGFNVHQLMQSASVSLKEEFGSALKNGDILNFKSSTFFEKRRAKSGVTLDFEDKITLRVIPTYQYESFTTKQKKLFFNTTYEVSNETNRMGVRLSGEVMEGVQKGIVSEGISYGAIQIPPHGMPIVLLKERQSIGGYPKIGTLLPLDGFKLSQSRPKTRVKFEKISHEKALELMRDFYAYKRY